MLSKLEQKAVGSFFKTTEGYPRAIPNKNFYYRLPFLNLLNFM